MDRRIERTRAAVEAATVELVASRGSQVGMTEIAAAAGVSRKAVYENFGSREQVLRCATQSLLARVPFPAQAVAADGRDPWEAALMPVARHMEQFSDYYRAVLTGPGCFLVRDAVVDHAATGLRNARARNGDLPVGATQKDDRFIVHGLVGIMADKLAQDHHADLQRVVRVLSGRLAAAAVG
ncbi:TetR/AcrR family transcriptional regulator [Kocuria tytonis]|uniref:TetR/AcrR family transcriptional regulator n=2 Tax=Kocuria tytonis TaxID=2054280 RepID=A0A495A5Q1_9MICC|nr:TetR/AcrR family transcriptional regulator [Kocuria tytonis]